MARWHSCNVLESASNARNLWQFSAGGGKFTLQRQEKRLPSEPLPEKVVAKDWQTLFQPKLNVAWVSSEHVFLRVVQLPKADLAETRSMVELQLEKLSPLPTTQIVWGFELLPHTDPEMQSAVVIIVARNHVEEFLGQLEGQGYLADRLELPFLDQLRALDVSGDGAWIFPAIGPDNYSCLAAWWYGGILQNLSLLHLPPSADRGRVFQEQLAQMRWAGELEGWLASPPRYRLVADGLQAEDWRNLFSLDLPVDIVPPLQSTELAALTARRSAANGVMTNLLPPEYTTRYRQQFIDRIWMRSLGAVLFLYMLGVGIYFGFVGFHKFKLNRVQSAIGKIGPAYTNTVQLREKVRVFQDQLDLQFAALECYKATSDFLPPELQLDSLNFDRGRKLTLTGTCSQSDAQKAYDFNDAMHKVMVKEQPLFSKVNAPSITPRQGDQKGWTFTCELKRGEAGMKTFFDKLNLRPGERRLVVIVGIVVFAVLNFWFVFPNFGKDSILQVRIKDAEDKLHRFKTETNQFPTYQKQLTNLLNQGVFVGEEEQSLVFSSDVDRQAREAGVQVLRLEPGARVAGGGRTNAFFDESLLTMTFSGTGEKELVTFLYNLGSRNSLIRVRSMNIGPELTTRMKLQGSLTLVQSFQKKPATRSIVTASPAAIKPSPPPAAKPPPVTPPEKKPPASKPASTTKTNSAAKPLKK